jgi:DNA-binding response OmpR family regulator
MTLRRLLIVDDHAGIARSIQMVAETAEFACQVVNRPEQATAVFKAFRPDVLILVP